MTVVLLPTDYTPGLAQAALALGLTVPDDASPYDRVLLPGRDLAEADGGAAPLRLRLDRFLKPNGIFLAPGLGRAIGRLLARRPAGIALDGSGPAWMLTDGHGGRVGEVPQVVTRVLFWQPPPRPVFVHFCPREMYGYYAWEWLRLLTSSPTEGADIMVDTPAFRMRYHFAHAHHEQLVHHPKARFRRELSARLNRFTNRLRFWR